MERGKPIMLPASVRDRIVRISAWSAAPLGVDPKQRKNFHNVQIDAVGIGLASAAAPFLPVFLTRLGASNLQVGLLTAMPALAGLLLGILVGRFLQTRRNIVPWFSLARLLVVSGYALTGLAGFFLPQDMFVNAILAIWALITLPQTIVQVGFSVVMNAVAGPTLRYELMSRRWSILGLTTAITVILVGVILDQVMFPLNYQLVFIGLSIGGLISFYYSSHIEIPDNPDNLGAKHKGRGQSKEYFQRVLNERPFILFVLKRFIYHTGISLAVPIFPLYYVRVIGANDTWIGIINTAQTAVLLIGYFFWMRESRLRGSRFVLLWATFGLTLYPALTALTHNVSMVALYAGLAGIFQAGLDLVFFDELMKTIPDEYSAIFVSVGQTFQQLAAFTAPLIGTLLAGMIGLGGALLVSALIRFLGFGLFAWWKRDVIVNAI
jgi:Na+/melibiose symporter-like transporter